MFVFVMFIKGEGMIIFFCWFVVLIEWLLDDLRIVDVFMLLMNYWCWWFEFWKV